jgi:hypothetical protein
MSRLIAYGCSYTYGHSLDDCVDPDNEALPGSVPSKFAYPQQVADALGIDECVNRAVPGSGNFNILLQLLDYDYRPDDVVIVMWTNFYRAAIIQQDSSVVNLNHWLITGEPSNPSFRNFLVDYIRRGTDLTREKYKNIALKFYDIHSDKHLMTTAWMYMDYAKLHLDRLNIKNLQLSHSVWNLKDCLTSDPRDSTHDFNEFIDVGVDKIHPGIKTHTLWAKEILKIYENK